MRKAPIIPGHGLRYAYVVEGARYGGMDMYQPGLMDLIKPWISGAGAVPHAAAS